MLGVVVGMVACSAFPVDAELALAHSVSDPVEAHVHGFGALGLDGIVGDACCYLVVGLDGCWAGLGMAHFGEDGADGCSFLAVVE